MFERSQQTGCTKTESDSGKPVLVFIILCILCIFVASFPGG